MDSQATYAPWRHWFVMASSVGRRIEFAAIKLLRDERPCSGGGYAHAEWWEPGFSCHWCGAAV